MRRGRIEASGARAYPKVFRLARILAARSCGEGAAPRGIQPRVRIAVGIGGAGIVGAGIGGVVIGVVRIGVVCAGVVCAGVIRAGVHLRLRAGMVTFFIEDMINGKAH